MSWPLEKIGSKCLPVESWNPAKDGAETSFQYIDIGSIDQDQKRVTSTTMVTGATAPSRARQLVRGHDVLVSTVRPNLNSVAKLTPVAQATTASTGFCVLRSDSKVLDSSYLFAWVRSSMFVNSLMKKIAGANYPAVSQSDVRNEEIPLPPLDDQKRIAHLLGKVEGLIAQRKQHLQQLDALLKSVFLEMFGDPVTNPKQFPIRRLSEFYVNPREGTKCGPFGSTLKKDELVESGVPVWNMDNIGPSGQMIMPFRMWITKEKFEELSAYEVLDGDIVISRAGTVGKMCVARMNGCPAVISTNLIRVRLGPELLPLHFVSLMLYCKGRLGRLKTGADGTFTHMNTGVLDSLEFPHPPITLQNQFATVVDKVEGIKRHYQQGLTDLEALYGALSQKAFAGELDLSRVRL